MSTRFLHATCYLRKYQQTDALKMKSNIKLTFPWFPVLMYVSSDIVYICNSIEYSTVTLRSFFAFLRQQSNPLQSPLWAPYLPLYLCAVHFISFSYSSAVSLFPTRATLAAIDLIKMTVIKIRSF